jgi:hypothetical protein|nr:MAG TPA: DNA-directed RNA polymerase [Caudoviricetes sp.]
MMADYISREAALQAANEWVSEACMAPVMRVSRLFDKLAKVPAADVAEVVHGQWISFLDGDHIMPERYYRCSRCGRVESRRQPYCHCGAKMDGAAE